MTQLFRPGEGQAPVTEARLPGTIKGYNRRWIVRLPLGMSRKPHHQKSLRGSKRDAQAYMDWYAGLLDAGSAPRKTVVGS